MLTWAEAKLNEYCPRLNAWLIVPLWAAASEKKANIVSLLIDHGANINVIDPTSKSSALYVSLEGTQNSEIAKTLLKHGASCSSQKPITSLMLAARQHPELVEMMLEQLRATGCDIQEVKKRDGFGRLALHYAAGGQRDARTDHAAATIVTSLCSEEADLYENDYYGRCCILASCEWLTHSYKSQEAALRWSAQNVWDRIQYLIETLKLPTLKQWQLWDRAGAEVTFAIIANKFPVEERDYFPFFERAMLARQQLSSEDVMTVETFIPYTEPITIQDLDALRNDFALALKHSLFAILRHLGPGTLRACISLNVYSSYCLERSLSQDAFATCFYALKTRPGMSELRRMIGLQHVNTLHIWRNTLYSLCIKIRPYLLNTYCSTTVTLEPVADTAWRDILIVFQACVDLFALSEFFEYEIIEQLTLICRCLGPLNDSRKEELQEIISGLAKIKSVSQWEELLTHGIERSMDDRSIVEIEGNGLGEMLINKYPLPLEGMLLVIQSAKSGGILLEACTKPLFFCYNQLQLLEDNTQTISEIRRTNLKRLMEMLVEEGGVHWDATDCTHNTAVNQFDATTVSRYINLQCLAARVIVAHAIYYEGYLSPSLVDFVKLHQ
jgi:hypothetical protein